MSNNNNFKRAKRQRRKFHKILMLLSEILDIDFNKKYPRRAFSDSVKRFVLWNQAYCCKRCGRFLDIYEFDHVDGNRENNHISNCQALCPICHAWKSRLRY